MKIIIKNLIIKLKNLLIKKPLNIFIENKIILTDELINLLVESYYYQIINNNNLIEDWELWCNKYQNQSIVNNMDKKDMIIYNNLKKITKSDDISIKNICKYKIKNILINENRSLPLLFNNKLNIDNGIIVNNIFFYTGAPIDILFGLLLLLTEFNNVGLNLIIDYPLSINEPLENYYIKLGINYPYKLEFSNIEIIWSFQKLFFPTYFDNEIEKKIIFSNYLVIPIGIETSLGSHANIILWDIKNKTVERFEPNGSNYPVGFNYNPELLDVLLENKFKNYDNNIKYFKPSNFLPTIGLQILENLETLKSKKIGDPNGFCGVWCIWWIFQRINNNNIPLENIANKLINNIKLDNISFKNIIRNFSNKITQIRDTFLKKYKIDINDWITNNYSQEILNNLEKDIYQYMNS
jgi:hypothetical protein